MTKKNLLTILLTASFINASEPESEIPTQDVPTQEAPHSFNDIKNQLTAISLNISLFHDEVYNQEAWNVFIEASKRFILASNTLAWEDPEYKKSFVSYMEILEQKADPSIHGHAYLGGIIGDKKREINKEDTIQVKLTIGHNETVSSEYWSTVINLTTQFMSNIKAIETDAQSRTIIKDYAITLFDQVALPREEVSARGLTSELIVDIGLNQ